jgi:phage terminase large subunit
MFDLSLIDSWEYVEEPIVFDVEIEDNHNYFIDAGKKILVHNSGKTYAILQLIITLATTTDAPQEDAVITVVSSSVPNLKKGAYRVFQEIISQHDGLKHFIKSHNQTDRTFKFTTGWTVEFNSYQTEQEAKQGKRQYLFVNEANGIKNYRIFWQLAKRTRIRTWLDYNPSAPFWVHEKLIGTSPESNDLGATVKFIRSDHRANPFLTEEEHRRTEGIKDPELWKVYARGITGSVSGLIFPNWKEMPDADFPHDETHIVGIDYGYTNDPTAAVKVVIISNNIYVHEMCYETALPPRNIDLIWKSNNITKECPIYSEHDKEMIPKLRMLGWQVYPARKGQGSIKAGIHVLKGYNVYYTASSFNLKIEKNKYEWALDLNSGKYINEPIEKYNHLMDAIRYAVYSHTYRQPM